jgi:hypothetical protein
MNLRNFRDLSSSWATATPREADPGFGDPALVK